MPRGLPVSNTGSLASLGPILRFAVYAVAVGFAIASVNAFISANRFATAGESARSDAVSGNAVQYMVLAVAAAVIGAVWHVIVRRRYNRAAQSEETPEGDA